MKNTKYLFVALGLVMMTANAPALAGDAAAGEAYYAKKCKMCHSTTAGKHTLGPSLAGIFGAKAAATDFAKYSDALKGSGAEWNEENLDKFLKNPKKFLGGKSTMRNKTKKDDDRANVIEYLKTLK